MGMSSLRNRLPPLGTLAAFEAASRLETFTRAAEELNLTQAAVSRQIRALEEHLGVRLFDRRRHDVVLTAEGARFAAKVNPALGVISDAAVSLKSGYVEDLTICSEICFAAHWLMPRLSKFQSLNKNLSLRIVTSGRPIDAETEEFDVALAYGTTKSTRLVSHALDRDTISAVCSPVVRDRIPSNCSAEELAGFDLIHFEQRGCDWMGWHEFLGHFEVRLREPPKLVFNTYNSALDAAIAGYGVMLGWRRAIDRPLSDGRLVEVESFSVPSPDPISAHVPHDRVDSDAVKKFVAWMREEMVPAEAANKHPHLDRP